MRLPGYREDFLATLDVARTGSLMGTPEWRSAFDRLKQFQSAWRKTLLQYMLWSIVIALFAAFGLAVVLERTRWMGGEALSLVYVGAAVVATIIAHRLARIAFEGFSGIAQDEMHVAEVILDRFKHERSASN